MGDEKTRQPFEIVEVLPPENHHDVLLPVPSASGAGAVYRGVPSMPRVPQPLVYPHQIAQVGVSVSDARRINFQWHTLRIRKVCRVTLTL